MTVTAWDEGLQTHPAVVLAAVERIGEAGDVWVNMQGIGIARASVLSLVTSESLHHALENGSQIAVLMAGRGTPQPVVVGVVADRIAPVTPDTSEPETDARVDGRKVVLTGKDEVTLKCGKASITLTKAGKVLLRGTYLLSRSSGVNRIKGGSVQIN